MPTEVVFKRRLPPLRKILWYRLRLWLFLVRFGARRQLRLLCFRALLATAKVLVKRAEEIRRQDAAL